MGESEVVLGFAYAGIQGAACEDRELGLTLLGEMTDQANPKRPRVLIITSGLASLIEGELTTWQLRAESPLIVELPDLRSAAADRPGLMAQIREAIGLNV